MSVHTGVIKLRGVLGASLTRCLPGSSARGQGTSINAACPVQRQVHQLVVFASPEVFQMKHVMSCHQASRLDVAAGLVDSVPTGTKLVTHVRLYAKALHGIEVEQRVAQALCLGGAEQRSIASLNVRRRTVQLHLIPPDVANLVCPAGTACQGCSLFHPGLSSQAVACRNGGAGRMTRLLTLSAWPAF